MENKVVNREGRIGQKKQENLFKLYLNEYDDFIYINESDSGTFDRYAEFLRWLDEKDAELKIKEKEFRKTYKDGIVKYDEDGEVVGVDVAALSALSRIHSDTYREVCGKIDFIFGEGTCKKYFRVMYEVNPNFVPDDECIYDFLEEITPVMNQLFSDRKKRIDLKFNKNRKGGKGNKYRTKDQLIRDYSAK